MPKRCSCPLVVSLFTVVLLIVLLKNKHRNAATSIRDIQLQQSNAISVDNCPRQYHRCVVEPTLHVTGILESAQYLLWTNASLVRFGDEDVNLILRQNVRFQNATRDLSEAMERVLQVEHSDFMIGLPEIFSGYSEMGPGYLDSYLKDSRKYIHDYLQSVLNPKRQYLHAVLSSVYFHHNECRCYCLLIEQFYTTMRKIWEGKDLIILRGDNKQTYTYDVYDTARSQTTFYAPRTQAWTSYRQLKALLMKQDKKKLFILACGPTCKVLTYDLFESGRRVLDLGHLAKDYDLYRSGREPVDFWND